MTVISALTLSPILNNRAVNSVSGRFSNRFRRHQHGTLSRKTPRIPRTLWLSVKSKYLVPTAPLLDAVCEVVRDEHPAQMLQAGAVLGPLLIPTAFLVQLVQCGEQVLVQNLQASLTLTLIQAVCGVVRIGCQTSGKHEQLNSDASCTTQQSRKQGCCQRRCGVRVGKHIKHIQMIMLSLQILPCQFLEAWFVFWPVCAGLPPFSSRTCVCPLPPQVGIGSQVASC